MNRLSPTAVRLAAALALAATAACRSGGPRISRLEVPDPPARAAFGRADRLRRRGDDDAALLALREAIDRSPFYVEAHRALQEIRLARLEKGALLLEYAALLEANPERAEAHYLHGRLLAPPEAQRERFEEALRLEPSFAWGWNGLAVVHRLQGDLPSARRAYERALEIDRSRPDYLVGLGEVLLADGRIDAAGEIARRGTRAHPRDARFHLLAAVLAIETGKGREGIGSALEAWRTHPEEGPPIRTLRRALERLGTEANLRRVRRALLEEGPEIPRATKGEGERFALLSGIERRLGDPFAALAHLERAVREGFPAHAGREERIELLVVCGRLEEAIAAWTEDTPTGVLEDSSNVLGSRWRSLRGAARVAAAAPGDPAAQESFAGALRRAGLTGAARLVAERARLLGSPTAGRLVEECRGYERFLEVVAETLAESRRASLRQVLRRLGERSTEILGRDVTEGSRFTVYFPIGTIVDPTAGAPGLPEWFGEWNRFALLGKRAGGRVEGIVMRALSRRPTPASILGRPISGEAVVGERREITPSFAAGGDDIAGAAVFEGYFLDLDVVRSRAAEIEETLARHGPRRDRIFADALPPARSEEEVLSVAEPLALEEKLLLLASDDSRGPWVERVLAAVELHERAHLADAAEFLPFLGSLPSVFPVLARALWRGGGIEASLEGRAELTALAASDDPRVALSGVLATARGGPGPHRSAYRDLVERLVRHLHRRLEEYPTLRPDRNLLQQLHRLEEKDLSRLLREVAAEEGLLREPKDESLSSRRPKG